MMRSPWRSISPMTTVACLPTAGCRLGTERSSPTVRAGDYVYACPRYAESFGTGAAMGDLPGNHTTGRFPIATDDTVHQYDRNPNAITVQELTYVQRSGCRGAVMRGHGRCRMNASGTRR